MGASARACVDEDAPRLGFNRVLKKSEGIGFSLTCIFGVSLKLSVGVGLASSRVVGRVRL